MVTKEDVTEALRGVEDPELGMDIVELGLLYDVEVDGPRVKVLHSLTSMGCPAGPMTRDDVIEALRSVEDPELGMDIVELGLLYDAEVQGPRVKVLYSLTSIGCPAGPLIQQNIEEVVRSLPGVEDVETELTWDPPWTPEKMSDDAKFILGFG